MWDGTCRLLYADGAEVEKYPEARIGLFGATGGLCLGAAGDLGTGGFFSGLIDDICIYDQAITP
ncbi:MAG: hypothetical protein ISS79_00360 [Phycisphaerae bacterium]|nr:hypothetical protein [Phycisphaerae bacterium]